MKLTYDGFTMEGTPEELKEMMTVMGAEFPERATTKAEEVETPKFKEGDRVKTLADGEDGDIKAGEVGRITDMRAAGDDEDDPYHIAVETEDGFDYFRPQDLELVEEKSSYAPKAGDIVVITDNTNHSRNEVGDIGKVGYVGATTAAVNVPDKPDSPTVNGNWTKFSEMRPATDEEKAKYEQASKFAKLGISEARKPGEFKKGDIVRTKFYGLLEVDSVDEEDDHPIKITIKGEPDAMMAEGCELIAPVESRVDV